MRECGDGPLLYVLFFGGGGGRGGEVMSHWRVGNLFEDIPKSNTANVTLP